MTSLRKSILLTFIITVSLCRISYSENEYLTKVIDSQPWKIFKSEQVHLYCLSGSEAETDNDIILKNRTQALKRIESFFGKKSPQHIKVFLIDSDKEAIGFSPGNAWPSSYACFNLYQPGKWAYEKHNYGHEITHIFSNMDNAFSNKMYPIGLLDEGLAEYLSAFSIDPHLRLTQHWQAHGVNEGYITIKANNLDYNTLSLYQVAGSFAKHLIEDYDKGKEKFVTLLRKTNRPGKGTKADFSKFKLAIEDVYGISLNKIEQNWNRTLKPYWKKRLPLNTTERNHIQSALKREGYGKLDKAYYNSFGRFLNLGVFTTDGKNIYIDATSDNKWSIKR